MVDASNVWCPEGFGGLTHWRFPRGFCALNFEVKRAVAFAKSEEGKEHPEVKRLVAAGRRRA